MCSGDEPAPECRLQRRLTAGAACENLKARCPYFFTAVKQYCQLCAPRSACLPPVPVSDAPILERGAMLHKSSCNCIVVLYLPMLPLKPTFLMTFPGSTCSHQRQCITTCFVVEQFQSRRRVMTCLVRATWPGKPLKDRLEQRSYRKILQEGTLQAVADPEGAFM
jgi:hypothetical protein